MNRKNRRGEASRQRQAKLTSSIGHLQVPPEARLQAINDQLKTLMGVSSKNFEGIQKAFAMMDVHTAVHYRIANDQYLDSLELHELAVSPTHLAVRHLLVLDGDIDFQGYHLLYAATMTVFFLFERLNQAVESERKSPLAEPAQSNDGLVPLPDFGGEHAST